MLVCPTASGSAESLNVSCLPMWGLCAVFVALQTKKETSEGTGMRSGVKGGEQRQRPPFTHGTQPILYLSLKYSILPIWGREQWTSSITKGRNICALQKRHDQSNFHVSLGASSSYSMALKQTPDWQKGFSHSDDVLTLITPLSDLGKPSKEQLALQTELRRLQSVRRQDEEEFDNQKQVLQAQLQSEVSHIST